MRLPWSALIVAALLVVALCCGAVAALLPDTASPMDAHDVMREISGIALIVASALLAIVGLALLPVLVDGEDM